MLFVVKCRNRGCEKVFQTAGEEDYQQTGDGGPSCCTGVEIEGNCPQCGGDDLEIIEEVGCDDT